MADPPQRKATSFDVAYHAGVSQPTVSRALRGSPAISEATRKKIEKVAAELNYRVDKNASSLRSQQTNTIALLFFEDPAPDGSQINPFYLSMLGAITRKCAAAGYDLLISFQDLSDDWHKDYQDSNRADGLILLGYGDYEQYRERLENLVAQGTHFVRWGMPMPSEPGLTLGSDNYGGGQAAASHLLERGCKNFGFIGTKSGTAPEFQARWRGYRDRLQEAGHEIDPSLQHQGISTEAAGEQAIEKFLATGEKFDAIFAASDLIAIGAMRALQRAGLAIPDDVAVVGFDDIPAAAMAVPPLTSVSQDLQRAGEALVSALVDEIGGKEIESFALPVSLNIRRSSAAD